MARQDRNNNSTISQEPTHQIIRVALYARVSTLNNQDPEMQLSELREYAGHRGLQITEEYIDQGVSGCKEYRPALNRLMADACRRRFDAILVWKIDRFGRSLKHLVNTLAELAALGVAFISLRDNLDLSTPSGRLMFQIIGAMAEFERALIQERVRARLRNAKAKGKRLGRPRAIKIIATLASTWRTNMSRVQRIVLVTYCLSLAYCCVWVPWSVTSSDRYGTDHQRLGYGWVWAGPRFSPAHSEHGNDFSDVDRFVMEYNAHASNSLSAMPDMPIIALRLAAVTAVLAAALLLAAGTRFSWGS